uniref:SCP domain-containing protein n=2 Tax=Mesocestoides corti TaxID=53468 RepID=A0A5K3FMU1_MESCO
MQQTKLQYALTGEFRRDSHTVQKMMLRLCVLIALIWNVKGQNLSQELRDNVTEFHRNLREGVQPNASNMMLVEYSVDLEKYAIQWTANCSISIPDYRKLPKGVQRILEYSYDHVPNPFDTLAKYASEKGNYNFTYNNCTGPCFSYKLLVWAGMTEIGCVQRECTHDNAREVAAYVFACLYKQVGNIYDERPYANGSSCSRCPAGYRCIRNQCAVPLTTTSTSTSTKLPVLGIATFAMFTIHFLR